MSCPCAENVTFGMCDITPRDARRRRKYIFLLRKMTKMLLKCNIELEVVQKKMKTGELTLSKFGRKSEVWNHFKQVVGSDNNS